jgi:hypothetical protein
MKKILLLTTLAIIIFICSCGDKYETAVIDINSLADKIISGITFDDQLMQISEENIKLIYNFGEYVNMIVYAGSGATAEEIILIECADSSTADKIYLNVDTYYKNKKFYFKDYNPDETYKLDKPIFARIGKYVIYCVSPNTAEVQKILDASIN